MPLDVRLRARAQSDIADIWAFIFDHNPDAAERFLGRVGTLIATLAEMPESGPQRDEYGLGIRRFPFNRYVMFYRAHPDYVEVVRVLHAARDITTDWIAE
jgi:toxin ParE1/3/4